MSRSLFFLASLLFSLAPKAQPPGVCPLHASDAATAQLIGRVKEVRLTAWVVDFSRHTIETGAQQTSCKTLYSEHGDVLEQLYYDADQQLDAHVLFQYDDAGRKRVSTTYDRHGERTLQTLYAHTADGALARMRLTDARAVTISTTEVSVAPTWTETLETYNDGETLRTRYDYDTAGHLLRFASSSPSTNTETRYRLDAAGQPIKASRQAAGKQQQAITFLHERDQTGNWTQRITFVNSTPVLLTKRTIVYY